MKIQVKSHDLPTIQTRAPEAAEIDEAPEIQFEKPGKAEIQTRPPAQTPTPVIPKVEEGEKEPVNLEDAFADIFGASKSGTGEEELLRIASQFSLQITAPQIKLLLYLMHRADKSDLNGWHEEAKLLRMFVVKWLEYKQNNNSDVFVMKALEHISLRHFINENSFKVNIDKG